MTVEGLGFFSWSERWALRCGQHRWFFFWPQVGTHILDSLLWPRPWSRWRRRRLRRSLPGRSRQLTRAPGLASVCFFLFFFCFLLILWCVGRWACFLRLGALVESAKVSVPEARAKEVANRATLGSESISRYTGTCTPACKPGMLAPTPNRHQERQTPKNPKRARRLRAARPRGALLAAEALERLQGQGRRHGLGCWVFLTVFKPLEGALLRSSLQSVRVPGFWLGDRNGHALCVSQVVDMRHHRPCSLPARRKRS